MKKPVKALRARQLDSSKLEKASGGRGTYHGYTQCNYCSYISWTPWDYCPSCGRPFDVAARGMISGKK